MNTPIKIAVALLVVPVIGIAVGLVSLTSVTIVPNEPLRHPCKVKAVDGTSMVLESGQIIGLDPGFSDNISNQLSRSDFQVDIEQGDTNGPGYFDIQQGNTNRLDIYVQRRGRNDIIRPLVFTIPVFHKTAGQTTEPG